MELTGACGAAITVDAVGHSGVVAQALRSTADYGQVILLGTPRVPAEMDVTPLWADIHLRWITVRGALEWCLPMYPVEGGGVSQLSKQEMIFDWITRGDLVLEPLISHRLAPSQIKEAYEGLEHQRDQYTGVLLDWSKEP
jgi:threonine dehydrogenase-like Zn-dependent dehydrogenase